MHPGLTSVSGTGSITLMILRQSTTYIYAFIKQKQHFIKPKPPKLEATKYQPTKLQHLLVKVNKMGRR